MYAYNFSGGGDIYYRIDGGSTWYWATGAYSNASGYFSVSFTVPRCAYSTVTIKGLGWGGGQSNEDFVYALC
ncbi:hypothetical protein ABZT47_38430 [Sphaerisporangium sp. NPDC005289]|uniref:hypothetical protein n=1 Tax=Sphaerisporangium sp. NPDC005289 TaxID=3155247 RepID=UPI0033AB49AC